MTTKIYFDLDGTVYDLYSIENWEPKLRAENVEVFKTWGATKTILPD